MRRNFPLSPRFLLGAVSVAALLSGCTVGPDFERPAAPPDQTYDSAATPNRTTQSDVHGGDAQHFALGADIPGEWWTLFHSPALDALVRQALAANPDLKAADATLRQAQELAAAQSGALLPSVDASFNQQRERIAGAQTGIPGYSPIYNLTTAQVSVSYTLDVFGGVHRAIEASEAAADYQRWQREAQVLTLTSNIVAAALQEASLRAQVAATQQIIDDETHQLDVINRQFTLGGASKTDVLSQQSLLAQSRATLPGLQKQLQQQRHLLATLAGNTPAQGIAQQFDLEKLTLPTELPLSLPAKLVEQRPDVQAATASLHEASANLGVAIANQWPKLTLSADLGSAAIDGAKFFTEGAEFWSLGAGVTQPIFHGEALSHQRAAAEAALEAAAAQYQSTVLNALRNVADTLKALQSDAETLARQLEAENAAAGSLALARQRYEVGAISYLTLLDAERTEAQAHISLIQAQTARFTDTAALLQALGGGWWNRPDMTPKGA
jgi:NodT family efflux transporter outer membrane factor (OMF) lipoprotein